MTWFTMILHIEYLPEKKETFCVCFNELHGSLLQNCSFKVKYSRKFSFYYAKIAKKLNYDFSSETIVDWFIDLSPYACVCPITRRCKCNTVVFSFLLILVYLFNNVS